MMIKPLVATNRLGCRKAKILDGDARRKDKDGDVGRQFFLRACLTCQERKCRSMKIMGIVVPLFYHQRLHKPMRSLSCLSRMMKNKRQHVARLHV